MYRLLFILFAIGCRISANAAVFTISDQQAHSIDLFFQTSDSKVSDDGVYSYISSDEGNLLHWQHCPDMPVFGYPLALPESAEISIEVLAADTVQLTYPIVPGRGLSMGVPAGEFSFGKMYNSDKAYPQHMAVLGKEYMLHSQRGQNLQIMPFQYFPQSGILVRISKIRIHITAKIAIPVITEGKFAKIEAQHFLNIKENNTARVRGSVIAKRKMLIICPSVFESQAQSYASSKQQLGTQCYVKTIKNGENPTEIKDIVKYHYTKYGIEYLLIIGDSAQIAPLHTTGSSDASYGYLSGNDAYAEISVGRISAETAQELDVQLQRTAQYERHRAPQLRNTYIMVASGEGPGDNDEYDYEHLREIKNQLEAFGMVTGNELYDGDRGENDAPKNPSTTDLIESINDGADLLLYLGHGNASTLQTTQMSIQDISLLDNAQWPFAMIGGCQVGNFAGGTCLAEAFMRAGSYQKPTGLVGILASSTDQLWSPPMCAQDAFVQSITEDAVQTLGQHILRAFRTMNTVYGEAGEKTASTWNLFGDPSVYLHTSPADTIVAQVPASVSAGTTVLTFECNWAGAYYSLTKRGEIVAEGTTSSGSNNAIANPLLPGEYTFSIFSPNTVTFVQQLSVDLSTEAMLAVTGIATDSDSTGRSIDCSMNEAIGAFIENISTVDVIGAEINITTNSPNITSALINKSIPKIASGEKIWMDSLALLMCKSVPKDYSFAYSAIISSESKESRYDGNIRTETPKYKIVSHRLLPTVGSNDNEFPEAGEILQLSLDLVNESQIKSQPQWLTIETSSNITAENIRYTLHEDSIWCSADIAISPSALPGETYFVQLLYGNTNYIQDVLYSGTLMQVCENWDAQNYQFAWNNELAYPWTRDGQAMRSGTVGSDGKSRIDIEYSSGTDDSISFLIKTSCEQSATFGNFTDYYDYLVFSIDNVSQMKWAGEADWKEYTFGVAAGKHIFSWEYNKDYDTDEGQDAVWLGAVCFPPSAEYFETPLTFIIEDSIVLFRGDTLSQLISLPTGAENVHIFGAPDWLGIEQSGEYWHLSGIATDTISADIRISCRIENRFTHGRTLLNIIHRPKADLSLSAWTDSTEVTTGNNGTIHFSVANRGNTSSSAFAMSIVSQSDLTIPNSAITIPAISPSGIFDSSFTVETVSCLQRDSTDKITLIAEYDRKTLLADVELPIKGINVFIENLGLEPGEINNGDSLLQTGELLSIYTTVRNASAIEKTADIWTNTDLGNWHFDGNIQSGNTMQFFGAQISVPTDWTTDIFSVASVLQVGSCRYSVMHEFASQQTTVSGLDTLWLANTGGDEYQLCLPKAVSLKILECDTAVKYEQNCLRMHRHLPEATVILGRASIQLGDSTGIAVIAVASQKLTAKKAGISHNLQWLFAENHLTVWTNEGSLTAFVVASDGKAVWQQSLSNAQTVSLGHLHAGVYALGLVSAISTESFMIVVE